MGTIILNWDDVYAPAVYSDQESNWQGVIDCISKRGEECFQCDMAGERPYEEGPTCLTNNFVFSFCLMALTFEAKFCSELYVCISTDVSGFAFT